MGPIKISIKTTQLEASEYGGGDTAVPAVTDCASEAAAPATTAETVEPAQSAGDESCYKYEGEECYYTEPASGVTYRWDTGNSQWVDRETGEARPAGTQTGPEQQNYKMEGGTYVYVDKLTNKKHKWNLDKSEWEEVDNDDAESDESELDENATEEEKKARQYRKRKAAPGWDKSNYSKDPVTGATTYKDPSDGVLYEFDEKKNAWFPKLDEDFMAVYQLNYGFTADGKAEPTKPAEESVKDVVEPVKKKPKVVKEQQPAKWFEEEESRSTKVYVSNLPTTITEETFVEWLSKCGLVENDARTKKPKIKLYKDVNNEPKGDGLCTYIKHESVELALTILDGSELEGNTVKVERAKFELKGEYDPKLKPKKLTKKQLDKAKKQKERLFEWIPDKMRGQRAKHEKVVVIKNLFDVGEVDADPGLILDYTKNIRSQCAKFGTVAKVTLYDKHQDGVCQVFFKEPSEADMAVQMLNGRLFGKRVMSVETWDGRTKFKVEESQEDESERLKQWEEYLSSDKDLKNEDGGDEKMDVAPSNGEKCVTE